jgi:drug/metabolite transporter (DMT)-like permease
MSGGDHTMTVRKLAALALPACGIALGALAPAEIRIPAVVIGGTLATCGVVFVSAYLTLDRAISRSIAHTRRLTAQMQAGVLPRATR